MTDFTDYILTALALVFIIEGLMYALFPDAMRRMLEMALMLEAGKLRQTGFIALAFGGVTLWILKSLN